MADERVSDGVLTFIAASEIDSIERKMARELIALRKAANAGDMRIRRPHGTRQAGEMNVTPEQCRELWRAFEIAAKRYRLTPAAYVVAKQSAKDNEQRALICYGAIVRSLNDSPVR